jgi:protein SCO1/2
MTSQSARQRDIRLTVFALTGIIALFVTLFVRQFVSPSRLDPEWLRARGVVLFETPRAFDAPRLIDQDGKPFDGAAFAGQWSVLFFGFTFCPDVCPTTLSLLHEVENALQDAAGDGNTGIGYFLVSVDPARDTPAVLKTYIRHFSPRFNGLTGEFLDVHRFATQLNVPFRKSPLEDGSYTIDHGANLVLINPRGHYAGYVTPPFDRERLVQLLGVLRKRES